MADLAVAGGVARVELPCGKSSGCRGAAEAGGMQQIADRGALEGRTGAGAAGTPMQPCEGMSRRMSSALTLPHERPQQ